MTITKELDFKNNQADTLEVKVLEKIISLDKLIRSYMYKYNSFENFPPMAKDCCSFTNYTEIGARQYEILHILYTKQCNKVSEVSKLLDLSISSLSLIISKMVANDLIEKNYETTDDSRNVVLSLTEFGENNYLILKNLYCNILKQFILSLSNEELELFQNAVTSLTDALSMFSIIYIEKNYDIDKISDLIFQNLFILKTPFEKFFRDIRNNLKDDLTLTDKEINILVIFADVKTSTPSKIAAMVHSSESTISTQLKKLVKKGHLEKSKSIEDSRITNFTLTESGSSTIQYELSLLNNQAIEIINTFKNQDKIKILDGLNYLHILFELLLKDN